MSIIDWVALAWLLLGVAIFPTQFRVTAPYGRHTRTDWGPSIPNQWGWCLMEVVSLLVFGALFLFGPAAKTAPMWVLFAIWILHYTNRSLIFPFRTHTRGKTMPVAIAASAAFFNVVNGSLNGLYLGWFGPTYPESWLTDPRFIIGLVVVLVGVAINQWADHRLINLRRDGGMGYSIPRGGLFRLISCPNHFGEIVEWTGFAIMAWNLPALSFAVWTAANLIPRAVSHHQWYGRTFADYPRDRKAVIPFLV